MDLSQARWRTSSYTNANNNNCVEIGPATDVIGIRDTKARERGALAVTAETFTALITAVKNDRIIR